MLFHPVAIIDLENYVGNALWKKSENWIVYWMAFSKWNW